MGRQKENRGDRRREKKERRGIGRGEEDIGGRRVEEKKGEERDGKTK